MDSMPFIVDLKRRLPESDWRRVVLALQTDPFTVRRLQDPDFYTRVQSRAGARPGLWAPGLIALQALGDPVAPGDLKDEPFRPVNGTLAAESERFLSEVFQGQSPAKLELEHAGLTALGIRERIRSDGEWSILGELLEVAPTTLARAALVCLYAYVPEPFDLLAHLFATGCDDKQFRAGLNVIFGNPLHEDAKEKLLSSLLDGLTLREKTTVLGFLSSHRRLMAGKIAPGCS